MKFSHRMTYDATPADVLAMLADPAFREKVCVAMHATRRDVSIDGAPETMKVVVDQTQPAEGIPSFVQRFRGLTDDERARLRRRLDEPTLWDAFLGVLAAKGLPVGDDDEVTDSVRRVAHDRSTYADVWALAEALIQHDELAAAWRARHVVMVERMIGTKTGTGGSTGANYLRSRLDLRYFPLLWDLRSVL